MDLYEIRIALNAGKSIYDLPLRVTYYARVSTDKGSVRIGLMLRDMLMRGSVEPASVSGKISCE